MELTKEMIKNADPRSIIFRGETTNDGNGLNMTGTGEPLRFVVYRGGIPDWCVYTQKAFQGWGFIRDCGDKVHTREYIENIVEFNDEVWKMYRH